MQPNRFIGHLYTGSLFLKEEIRNCFEKALLTIKCGKSVDLHTYLDLKKTLSRQWGSRDRFAHGPLGRFNLVFGYTLNCSRKYWCIEWNILRNICQINSISCHIDIFDSLQGFFLSELQRPNHMALWQ